MDWQAALNKMQKYETKNSKNIPSVIIEESGQNPQYENCRWEPYNVGAGINYACSVYLSSKINPNLAPDQTHLFAAYFFVDKHRKY